MAALALSHFSTYESVPDAGKKPPQSLSLPAEHRGTDGIDVAQLLDDASVFPPPTAQATPTWTRDPEPVASALKEAILGHRDVSQRALDDLLTAPATNARSLGFGPLNQQLGAPQAGTLPEAVAKEILSALRKIAGSGARSAGNNRSKADESVDVARRGSALRVLGRLRALPATAAESVAALRASAQNEAAPE